MWKNASGAQKRRRKIEQEIAQQPAKYRKLGSFMFGRRPADGQLINIKKLMNYFSSLVFSE